MLGVAFGGMGSLLSGSSLLKFGFMAASALGMYLFNGNKEKGEVARLDDLKVSSSSYGRGIPIVFGTMRVTGNMIWATDFEETLRYLSPKGKGGKKGEKKGTPYYEYHANFAMALCEGPVEELLRVWADSNLIYDKHNPDNEDIVGPGFSQAQGGGGKAGFGASSKKGGQGGDSGRFEFRFYSGTETQMPDPFMVKTQGADLVPAHRGMAYLFFEHFALMDFGNRIPTITAEVAVRKKDAIHHSVMENLPNGPDFGIPITGGKAFLDPERYRLYATHLKDGKRYLRVWDLSQDREIRQISFDEIAEINKNESVGSGNPRGGTYKWGIGTYGIIGVAGTGDLVVHVTGPGTANSDPVAFLDPNTFAQKAIFGNKWVSAVNGLIPSDSHLPVPTKATPGAYIHVEFDVLSMEPKIEPRRCTFVLTYPGWVYVFGQEHEPLTRFRIPGTWLSQDIEIIPTEPDIFGGKMYILMNKAGLDCVAMELSWAIKNTLSGGIYQISNSETIAGYKVISMKDPTATSTYYYQGQMLANLERIVFFETVNHRDPDKIGLWATIYNPATKEIEDRFRVNTNVTNGPGVRGNSGLPPLYINPSNFVKWVVGTTVWSVDFAQRKVSYYTFDRNLPASNAYQTYWPQRGAVIRMVQHENQWKWAMTLLDRADQVPVDVKDIFQDLVTRVGLPVTKVNTTELNSDTIMGYVIENPASARRVIEELAQVFMFDVAEIDYQLKVVSRGKDAITTVPQQDLVALDDQTQDYFLETRVQEIDLPQTVVVNYINPDKDYQVNSQHYRRPRSPMHVMQSRDKLEVQLAMSMKNDTAKQMAHKVSMSVWSERTQYDFMLPWKYLIYDPTDVLKFQMDDGLTFDARMMKMDLGANFVIEANGVSQTHASYISDAKGSEDGGTIYTPKPWPPVTQPVVFNVPYLEDGDDIGNAQFAYYFGAGALTAGLQAAVIEYRLEGTDWDLAGLAYQELVWGYVRGVVPPPPWGPWTTDDVTVLTLVPTHDYGDRYEWESIPASEWPSEKNCIIVGEEIIYFRDVTLLDSGEVQISHLIRGARGTENAAFSHTKTSEVFAIRTQGLMEGESSMAYLNRTFEFRSFSTYSILPPYLYNIKLEGASHKPWGPNFFKRSVSGSNVRITWERRTRFGGQFKDGTGTVPLNEESEVYEVYLLHAPYPEVNFDPSNPDTYVRAFLDVTQKRIDYTPSMQAQDGWDPSMPIYLVAFQVSAQVGRGFPGYATLYPSILI